MKTIYRNKEFGVEASVELKRLNVYAVTVVDMDTGKTVGVREFKNGKADWAGLEGAHAYAEKCTACDAHMEYVV